VSPLDVGSIAGSGGGGGKGGGGSGGTTPTEAPNSLRSSQKATVIDALCEGPIAGLVNGAQSVFFDKTPLQNADGSYNFNNAVFGYTTGDIASNYSGMSQMSGDGGNVEATTPVGVRVWQATPIVRNVTTPNIDALRVTVSVPSLTYQDPSNGNVSGSSVEYTIDIQSNEGGFVTAVHDTISGKTTSRYSRSYLIPLTGAGPFDVRVTRITGDSGQTYLQNELWFDDFTSIVSTKLEYRHTALAGISIDAQQFSAIPTRAFDVRGLVINVPSNYDPPSRSYTGTWDGTFKLAWSDNPAWCLYDLLTNGRYGLGDKIDTTQINKWQLYTIGQYCDQLVPDGFGGQEPRFTCNLYIQTEEDAYKVIQNLASIFRAIVFWSAGSIAVMQDAPADAVQMFAPANVINGAFKYQGTSLKSRHSVALVSWNDPNNWYQQKIEYVQDDAAVTKYGVVKSQITAFGCTSRGQAHRVGKWLLYSEQLETETVTFRCGMDGAYIYPGAVIQTSDPNRAGKRMAGRVVSTSTDRNYVTVDAPPTITAGTAAAIQVLMPDGTLASRSIAAVNGKVVTLAAPLPQTPVANAIFMIAETNVEPELWRVVTITEVETNQIEIGAVAHNPSKYAYIEQGLALAIPQTSNLTATPAVPTNLTVLVSRYVIDIGVAGLRLTLSWSGSANRFTVSYQKANGQLVTVVQNQNSIDIDNVDQGAVYTFSVAAVSTLGFTSQPAITTATVAAPPVADPDDVTGFTATVTTNGVQLAWNDIASPMLYDYEIREGTNWDTATSLGFFAGTSASVPPLPSAGYRWMIKARDKLLNESANPDIATLGVSAPAQPAIGASLSGQNYVLSWNTPASMFPIDHYLIATGASLNSAAQIAQAYTTQYQSKVDFGGTRSFWVAAVDVAGNTGPYGLVQLTVTAPAQPSVTTQVIDNNVLLYWTDATRSLPITTYQLGKGPDYATSQVIGTKSGLFTTVFETVAGTYTYWVVGIDSAGNLGTPGRITATVNAPPDYVLHSDIFSAFGGTLSNARLDEGAVVIPVDTASSWAQHFTGNSWNTPADQIAAGYPVYAQPTLQSGYYEEVIDYGSTLPATNVTVTPTTEILAGSPTYSVTISSSNTSGAGPWTDYPDTLQVYLTNFRWIKIRVTVTSADNRSLLTMTSLETKLDVKLKSDAGMVLANASDTNGTNVTFNVPFVDVASITLTPQGSTPVTAIYEFSGLPHPANFQVMLFNPSGQRTSGTISWAAKGY
jgi:predicted phage tail protein